MELQTFAPDLEKLGYKYISLSEEDKSFLMKYGGVFYTWSHKHDPSLTPMTICSCGIKTPYVVKQCIFCGNKNFRRQLSANRKMKQENIDTTIVEKVVLSESEIRKYGFHVKYKLDIVLYETMYNFIKDELYKKGQHDIFYIGLIRLNDAGEREIVIFNEDNEQIPMIEFMKKMKLNRLSDAGIFIENVLKSVHGSDISFYNLGFLRSSNNFTHDRFQKEINKTFLKDLNYLNHSFIDYFDGNSANYNEKHYDYSKSNYEFFKLSKYSFDYLVNLNKKTRRYGMGILNHEYVAKLQKMNDFLNRELFVKYPQLENVTFDTLYDLYRIISSNKTKEKHTIDGVISYCNNLHQNEALLFEQSIHYYAEYLRKVKKSNVEMYIKQLKLNSTTI